MRILQIIGALFILVASPAVSKEVAASWIVTQKSGDVRVLRNGVQPASVQLRAALSPGDVIATGANGRAMLTKGEDYVVVAPASRLMLPKEQQQTGFTRLLQQMGTMLYKVKRTGVPHFAVETPMLAAVVKGTTFTVVVDDSRAAVQVTEGTVEVSSLTGDARRLVEGGMTVYIGRERPNDIIDVKSSADLPRSDGGSGEAVKIEGSDSVSLRTIANLTDGLLSVSPVAPVVAVADTPATNLVSATAPSATPTTGPVGAVLTDAIAPVANIVEPLPSTIDNLVDVVDTTAPSVTDPVIDIVDAVLPPVTDPVIDIVDAVVPSLTDPVIDIVDAVVPSVTDPVIDIVDAVLPSVTDPVIDIVDAVVPSVTDPVIDIVDAVVPSVTDPVIEIVDAVVPAVTDPVIDIVDAVLPSVTDPVIDIVDAVLPSVTEPVVEIVETTVPAVTEPVVEIVETTVPEVIEPVVEIVEATVPAVTEPVVEIVETTVPAVTEPVVEVVEALPSIICVLLCPR